ncbi:DNA-packaging protein [Pelagimonas sp. KU-00592-HH]|uniref:DNA-packaging protein n=1 Tax=Pelagimonas sp. KU-00592-HH TaxID=3127651 RepID=UPI0031028ADA
MSKDDGKRDAEGRFLPGNKFWQARSSAGPKPLFETPEALEIACMEYFDWVHENPLVTVELVKFQGEAKQAEVPKMRAMTIGGLCLFLDVTQRTWSMWREDRADLLPVITRVEEIIRAQKFEGAAADLLNPNIIARDLGLADKKELSGEMNVRTLSDFYASPDGPSDA